MEAVPFKLIKYSLLLLFLLLAGTMVMGYMTISTTRALCFDDPEKLPEKKVGLLLGTSKFRTTGEVNLYYQYRIDAAVRLFQAGKIKFILVSGDNATSSYNEPSTFRQDLIAAGIPSERIVLDFAGFRTFDSIVRCKEVFQEDDIIIISQQFHNERALFIADHKGVNALAFNARDVGLRYGWKTQIREVFARVKTMLDLFILHTQPKFLGDKILIS